MNKRLRKINKKAKDVMDFLTKGLCRPGDHNKIDKSDAFMSVSVELINFGKKKCEDIFSVAHYGEQNGDLMRDPDVTFVRIEKEYYPLTIRNDYSGYNACYAEVTSERVVYDRYMQKDLAIFCGKWMENIKYQQEI